MMYSEYIIHMQMKYNEYIINMQMKYASHVSIYTHHSAVYMGATKNETKLTFPIN